jgi:3-hydroxyacyl-CoA dehydrogenase
MTKKERLKNLMKLLDVINDPSVQDEMFDRALEVMEKIANEYVESSDTNLLQNKG